MKYAALCCIAKDEDLFLKEWLAYHSALGFEHFVIYDNNSAVPIAGLLSGFGDISITILRSEEQKTQHVAYTHCLSLFGRYFKWIGFLDVDEFIRISADSGDIRAFLAEFEPYAGVGLNWRMFSSSGHETRPEGLVMDNYARYTQDSIHIKSLVQPALVTHCANPHAFMPKDREVCVDAEHFPLPPGFPFAVPATQKACVNHYYYKSRECFAQKIAKGNPCNIVRRMDEFESHLQLPTQHDAAITTQSPKVRAALAENRAALPESPATEIFGPVSFSAEEITPELSPPASSLDENTPPTAALLNAARSYVRKKKYLAARICLCHAMLRPDEQTFLAVWNLRAEIARATRRRDLAMHCLKQALSRNASAQSYLELANLFMDARRMEQSKKTLEIIKAYEAFHS